MLRKLIRSSAYFGSIAAGVYTITSFPGFHKKDRRRPLLGHHYAHRGLYDPEARIPENSMAAFARAADAGYGIEMDVHLTADNRTVVFHDDLLLRMCGVNKELNGLTLKELEDLRLSGTDERIPGFKEVLDLVDGRVPLIIELKVDHGNYSLLCPLVWQILKDYKGVYCIESFHPGVLLWFRFNHPEVVRGQLSCNFFREKPHADAALFLMTHLMTNFLTAPDFIAYKYKDIDTPAFFLCRRLWKAMTVLWTIPDQKTLEDFRSRADLMIFEGFRPQ